MPTDREFEIQSQARNKHRLKPVLISWRRRRDSNPRTRLPQSNDLANRPLKPLGYPSPVSTRVIVAENHLLRERRVQWHLRCIKAPNQLFTTGGSMSQMPEPYYSGKVRDIYELPDQPGKWLVITSDRISIF